MLLRLSVCLHFFGVTYLNIADLALDHLPGLLFGSGCLLFLCWLGLLLGRLSLEGSQIEVVSGGSLVSSKIGVTFKSLAADFTATLLSVS